jgi:hypothetical protein
VHVTLLNLLNTPCTQNSPNSLLLQERKLGAETCPSHNSKTLKLRFQLSHVTGELRSFFFFFFFLHLSSMYKYLFILRGEHAMPVVCQSTHMEIGGQ